MGERESPTGRSIAKWVECLNLAEQALRTDSHHSGWAESIVIFYGVQQLPPHRHSKRYMKGVVRDMKRLTKS